jgi:hypothetical protein
MNICKTFFEIPLTNVVRFHLHFGGLQPAMARLARRAGNHPGKDSFAVEARIVPLSKIFRVFLENVLLNLS